jgi:eukaryotic-like serine/threonine-protein kinase
MDAKYSENPTVQAPPARPENDTPEPAHPVTVRLGDAHRRIEELLKSLDGAEHIPEFAARLIWEELRFRQNQGEAAICAEEFLERHPAWAKELERLQRLSGWEDTIPFPTVGEEIAGYHLVAELGRGGQGQVFLARQLALASRPVVLKFTACEGSEHLNLARLQHTYIVPLFGVEEIPGRNLRLMCMPFLGGITLTQLLGHFKNRAKHGRSGAEIELILQEVQRLYDQDLPRRDRSANQLGKLSYQAIMCQVGLCLAEALGYAHQMGMVHLDIKPSNILVGPDARPLLLDFHLSRSPVRGGEKKLGDFGGTWRYMSPEQRIALVAASNGDVIPVAVDHRSDIYSLGLVLYEALGGERSEGDAPRPQGLPTSNPDVSPGLADILAKCLAENPADRYADASALADDLHRHLEHRPLRWVPNRSWRERWQKWRRRSPLALSIYTLAAGLLIAGMGTGATLLLQYQDRRLSAEIALSQGNDFLAKKRFDQAADVFRHGQDLIAGLPGNAALERALAEQHRLAEYLRKAEDLHTTVNAMRFYAFIDPLPRRGVLLVDLAAKNLWARRAELSAPPGLPLESEVKERIQADLRDLALLRAEVQVRLAPAAEHKAANEAALQLLDEAESAFGKHPAIVLERHRYAIALGLKRVDGAVMLKAQTPWEHAFLARAYMHGGDYARAEAELRHGLRLQPVHYLSHFYLGYCCLQQRRNADAVTALTFCEGQDPRSEVYYFRALCHVAEGRQELGLADFEQARKRDSFVAEVVEKHPSYEKARSPRKTIPD